MLLHNLKLHTMRKTFILILLTIFTFTISAQKQKTKQDDWAVLEARKTPEWFADAKLGIFIHWGLYSVPAWSPKGTYSEWYKYWLENKTLMGNGDFTGTEIYDYHVANYGKDFHYRDFAPMFKAQNFDADAWADLFAKSGAKYAVLTTKHHDGFALWPSKEASRDYARPWNSTEIGAHRDLVREYADAMRKKDIKVGFYITLRQWGNPIYTPETMDLFVDTHFLPQIKDLTNNYLPDLLWSDGPDSFDENQWKVKETFQWLYTESPVKDKIVLNDRWANTMGDKFKKRGDYYTPEYSSTDHVYDKPWEECRGLGFSFGYNRNEDIEDYATPQMLVLMLANIVSNGGNLLLNIGPDADGKIPPIMQERLLQLGEWLRVNGEAIYGTRRPETPVQWSEGDRNWKSGAKHYEPAYRILKETVDPDKGFAVKEAFFTKKGDNTLYAILPVYHKTEFRLKNIPVSATSKISMLGSDKKVEWRQDGNDVLVKLPTFEFQEAPCDYAWTLKIEK